MEGDRIGDRKGQASIPSKYRFIEYADGFAIEAANRRSMRVRLVETGFEVHPWKPRQLFLFDIHDPDASEQRPSTNLLHYRRLVQLIAEGLMRTWRPPNKVIPFDSVRRAAVSRTRRAIGRRVHQQWRRLVASANENVHRTQKAVFCTGAFDAGILHDPWLYRHPYLVRDIQRYRAAASIVAMGDQLFLDQLERANPNGDFESLQSSDRADRIEFLSDWQSVLSVTGHSYGSLRRTLMQLPGGIPVSLLCSLQDVYLDRTIHDRVELITLLLAHQCMAEDAEERIGLTKRFMHVSRAEIADAVELIARHQERRLSIRRTSDLLVFVRFLLDCPEDHKGKLTGFARKAIRWHEQFDRLEADDFTFDLDRSLPAARPRIPLPTAPGIRFLDSVEAIFAEGIEMRHCIASYAEAAVRGRSYLFRVDYQGERASAEVQANGALRQCYGPANKLNAASEYASHVLSEWGQQIAEAAYSPRARA